jgi:hypothetical protein
MRQACPQLAKAEMHPPKRGSGFDPQETYAALDLLLRKLINGPIPLVAIS